MNKPYILSLCCQMFFMKPYNTLPQSTMFYFYSVFSKVLIFVSLIIIIKCIYGELLLAFVIVFYKAQSREKYVINNLLFYRIAKRLIIDESLHLP